MHQHIADCTSTIQTLLCAVSHRAVRFAMQNVVNQASAWAAGGRWAELAAEKAAALAQMARTLETYSRLLESAAPPADGAARLLQQVMR